VTDSDSSRPASESYTYCDIGDGECKTWTVETAHSMAWHRGRVDCGIAAIVEAKTKTKAAAEAGARIEEEE